MHVDEHSRCAACTTKFAWSININIELFRVSQQFVHLIRCSLMLLTLHYNSSRVVLDDALRMNAPPSVFRVDFPSKFQPHNGQLYSTSIWCTKCKFTFKLDLNAMHLPSYSLLTEVKYSPLRLSPFLLSLILLWHTVLLTSICSV